MHYQKFTPHDELKPFVVCYFTWKGVAEKEIDIQSPPNNFAAIVFNYASPYQSYQNNTSKIVTPKAFACGLFTSNYHLVLKGKIGMVGIVFKATAMHNFFGLRMSGLVNNRMALEHILPDETGIVLHAIENALTDEDKIKILEQFVLKRLADAKSRLSVIDDAMELIDQHNGSISVVDVANRLKISKRYLEKKFLEKVGVSPKFYTRIKRFAHLSNILAHSPKVDWQDIVFQNGFHDQSHLVKEFMEFNQMNPSEYHLKHNELIRFVKR